MFTPQPSPFAGKNIRLFDIETWYSADDCRLCNRASQEHAAHGDYEGWHAFAKRGWEEKEQLGISIGCYYDYRDGEEYFFDARSCVQLMERWITEEPILVGYNSIGFDSALMVAVARAQVQDSITPDSYRAKIEATCREFTVMAQSLAYDMLAQIWQKDPAGKFTKGNSLDAVLRANGLPGKTGHGAEAPRRWQQGWYAETIEYCRTDVRVTRALFELIHAAQGHVKRGGNLPPVRLDVLDPATLDVQLCQ